MAKPEWMPPRLYQWTKPRSLGLHALFLIVAGGCGVAMWWQVHRAMQGNVLSYLYSVEWPAIAVVAGIGWWQMFHDTPEDIARRSEYHRRMRAASAEVVARTLPRSARALTVDSSEVAGRALGRGSTPALARESSGGRSPAGGGRLDASSGAALVATGQGVAARTERPDGGAVLLGPEDSDLPDDEMSEYNRYLATLALKGKAKTWRNPHGL
ncbi:MAG: hypothetical protein KGQ66_07245 [Acidobacteriota bacterium]|nr:hypothetical protein [Acidobacteriota bacterium]